MASSLRVKSFSMAAMLLLCALLASGTGTCAATARAAATKRVSMAYNGPASQEKNAVHLFAAIFKEYVEARTNGRVQIVLYPDSQLRWLMLTLLGISHRAHPQDATPGRFPRRCALSAGLGS